MKKGVFNQQGGRILGLFVIILILVGLFIGIFYFYELATYSLYWVSLIVFAILLFFIGILILGFFSGKPKKEKLGSYEMTFMNGKTENELLKEAPIPTDLILRRRTLGPLPFPETPKSAKMIKDKYEEYEKKGKEVVRKREIKRAKEARAKVVGLRRVLEQMPPQSELRPKHKKLLKEFELLMEEPPQPIALSTLEPINLPRTKKPIELIREFEKACYKHIKKKNLGFAEVFYAKMKPVYVRLSSRDMEEIYPDLVDLQNKLVMLRLRNLKNSLKPEPKKRKSSRKKKVTKKKTTRKKRK
mgnify:FL=1